ncbi:Serine/threonine-protein kinase ATG1 [Candida viswanathii]|uniref:non-specific serine/threonine protein kinase n=1 Tax=Candida viswanathii TaxID=5486 RepID=A0A367XS44_9ASCO|nr:Serine/threonine-protein kinase ATG1 [Candida viswanathii]
MKYQEYTKSRKDNTKSEMKGAATEGVVPVTQQMRRKSSLSDSDIPQLEEHFKFNNPKEVPSTRNINQRVYYHVDYRYEQEPVCRDQTVVPTALQDNAVKISSPLNPRSAASAATIRQPLYKERKKSLRENICNNQFNNHYKKGPVYSPFPNAKHLDNDEELIVKRSFATVYKCINTTNNRAVAIKSVYRSKLKSKKLIENLEIEILILKNMKHPHIVGLLDYKQTSSYFHLVMDYCSMGDLSVHGLNEVLVLHFLKQLSSALSFLRSKSLVHRDINHRTCCCAPSAFKEGIYRGRVVGLWELPILKIADFGFARFLPSTSMAETLCGSPLYMAPEILRYEKYNAKADLWSVGAVLYEMTVGKPPFKAGNHIELLKNIEKANDRIKFPSAAQVPESDPLITGDLEETDEPLETSEMDENLFISEYISPIKPSERSQFINPIPLTPVVKEENTREVEETIKRPVTKSQKDDLVLEKDYVVVERKEIVDDIFDKLPTTTAADTITSGTPRQRRTSSTGSNRRPSFTERKISISPTNALSKALFMASHKLFGTTAVSAQQPPNSSTPVSAIAENEIDDDLIYGTGASPEIAVTAIVSTSNNDDMVLLRLEMLANMAHSVKTLADVKYKQVIPRRHHQIPLKTKRKLDCPMR